MTYNKISNTGLEISSIALGTWVFGGDMWGGAKESDCMDAVSAAVDHGINLIDTAPIYGYGLAEEIVGRAIKGRRDKLIIATKCGLVGRGKNITNNLTPSSIKREVEESLRRLQIDTIDIYQCHWPDPRTPIEQTLEAMCGLFRITSRSVAEHFEYEYHQDEDANVSAHLEHVRKLPEDAQEMY